MGTGLFLTVVVGFEIGFGRKTLGISGMSLSCAAIAGLLVSPLLEEVLFRGLVMNEFARAFSPGSANLLVSILFAGIHVPYWFYHLGVTQAVLVNLGGVFFFSLLAGWVYLQARSVWPAIVAHIANNVAAQLLVAVNR